MKNVKKCSLSGIAFTMDTDAYETLNAYMDSLRASCGKGADGDEIVADIEARIAELILNTHSTEQVVERPLVENIIRQMGRPEDISSESENPSESSPTEQSAEPSTDEEPSDSAAGGPKEPRIPRRLYRDMGSAKLGGVCAGLARYFNTDPVWMRLIFLLPLLLMPMSGIGRFVGVFLGAWLFNVFVMFVLAYMVMWFAVPAARSARQKLEMNGERITAQSIKDATMAGSAADADSEAKHVVANVVTVFGQVVLILLKILAGIIVFCLILAACAMIVGLLVVVISGSSELIHSDYSALISSLGISVLLVPVMLLIYVLMCLIASRKPGSKTVAAMFVLWIAAIAALIAAAICDYNSVGSSKSLRNRTVSIVVDGDSDTDTEIETDTETETEEADIDSERGTSDLAAGESSQHEESL